MCTMDPAMQAQQAALKSMPNYGKRPDGTNKGRGYLGEIKNKDGSIMTEVTTGVEINGKEIDIPLITKYSTKEDIEYLQNSDIKSKDFYKNMPAGMMDRAVQHAMDRKKAGKPYYAD